MNISDEQLDQLGRMADTCDNLVAASALPLSPQTHVEQLRLGLESISSEMKALYAGVTGEHPWED